MKTIIRVVLVIVLGGILVGTGYWYYDSRVASASAAESDTGLTQVVTVKRGTLDATLSVVGSLEAVQSADLAFTEMSGTAELQGLEVQAGQTITAGQVLATIDAASYQQALDQANSDLETAEEALADLTTPATALEIAQADVAVASAKVDLQSAQDALDDLQNPDLADLEAAVSDAKVALADARVDLLAVQQDTSDDDDQIQELREADADAWAVYDDFAHKVHSDDDREYQEQLMLVYNEMMDAQDALKTAQLNDQLSLLQAQIAVRNDEEALASAKEDLADAKAGGDPLELAQAKVAVHQAEVDLEAAQEDQAELEEAADATDVAAAQATVDAQQLAVSDAKAALAGTQLLAPFDGTVLEIDVSAGDPVDSSTTILTLANLDAFEVVASVDETTIRQVKAGQAASISFDAYPDQVFQGKVLSVPLQGTLQGDVTVYEVPLSLEGAEGLNLLVGMTANVEIEVGEATDALLVPAMALEKANGGYQVLVPNTTDPTSGEPETVPVQVGLSDGTYTQILKGLNVGDQVIVELDVSDSQTNNRSGGTGIFSNFFGFMGRH